MYHLSLTRTSCSYVALAYSFEPEDGKPHIQDKFFRKIAFGCPPVPGYRKGSLPPPIEHLPLNLTLQRAQYSLASRRETWILRAPIRREGKL
jgi:hypothetical protein